MLSKEIHTSDLKSKLTIDEAIQLTTTIPVIIANLYRT